MKIQTGKIVYVFHLVMTTMVHATDVSHAALLFAQNFVDLWSPLAMSTQYRFNLFSKNKKQTS